MSNTETVPVTEPPSEVDRERRQTLLFLKIGSVGLFFVALIGTAFTELSTEFPGGPSQGGVMRAEAFYLALVAVPSIWLLILDSWPGSRPHGGRGPSITGAVIGLTSLALSLFFIGPPLFRATSDEVGTAIARAQEPTAAETAFTPAGLEAAATEFVAAGATAAGATAVTDQDAPLEESCRLNNLDPGVSYRSISYFLTSSADEEETLSTVAATWESAGYTVERHPGSPDNERPGVTASGGIMAFAGASFIGPSGVPVVGPDDHNLRIIFETICVQK